MKAARFLLVLCLAGTGFAQNPTPPPAALPSPTANGRELQQLLQDGLFEEEANRNLEKASAAYEALLQAFQKQRQYAATALFRLAEIRAKQERKDDALALYQRVIGEFPDDPLARLSRERITGLGGKPGEPGAPVNDEEAREITRLQDLVKNSPDLLNAAVDGVTPLAKAADRGWLRAADFLLDHGADLASRGGGSPALHHAAGAGRKAMVEKLLARGADPKLQDSAGGTALMWAVANSHVEVSRVLLERGAPPNTANISDQAPLHLASEKGNLELMTLLLDHGADPNQVSKSTAFDLGRVPSRSGDETKGTPLMISVRVDKLEAVKLLLSRKADPNVEVPPSLTAISLAVRAKNREMVRLLLESGAKPTQPTLLGFALGENDLDLLRLLAKHGADVNAIDPNTGEPPLHRAVGESMEMTKLLLELGARADTLPEKVVSPLFRLLNRFPPLQSAQSIPRPPQAPAPRQRVRMVNSRNTSDGSGAPAESPDIIEMFKLLVSKGADVNAKDAQGQSVLHHALGGSAPLEFVEWLLSKGADVNAKNAQGQTPAMIAPMERRLWLEARTIFLPLVKGRSIHTVLRLSSPNLANSAPHRAAPVAEFDTPPTIDELLRDAISANKEDHRMIQRNAQIVVYRANAAGSVDQIGKAWVDPSIEGPEPPILQWGDVMVVADFSAPNSRFNASATLNLHDLRIRPKAAAVKKLTVQLGDRRGEYLVHGMHTEAVWAATVDPLPEWTFSEQVERLVGAEPRADLSAVKVQRNNGEKPQEWTVDLRGEGGGVKRLPARLADGDVIVIPLLPEADSRALASRKTGIFRAAPGRLFGETVFRFSEKDSAPRTLCDLITEAYSRSSMLVPEPDFAHIRIYRMKADGAGEETLEVDLAAKIPTISAQSPREEIRKLDVPLLPGDIVEFAPRKGAATEKWTGLDGAAQLFLTKAVGRDVFRQNIPGVSEELSLNPGFADYRRVSTDHAGLWFAQVPGGSFFRALSLTGDKKNLLRARVYSGKSVREFTLAELEAVNPWLIDGDRLELERF